MSTIGVDITPIQGPHRMRGVGSTVINVLTHISDEDKRDNVFVFFVYELNKQEALDLINASSFPNYEFRLVPAAPPQSPSIKTARGLLNIPARLKYMSDTKNIGTKQITEITDLDVFLQFEQDVIPPKGVGSVVIAYDLIPYVLEADYLWSYSTARKHHGYSRRGALKAHVKRHLYINTIRTVMNRAQKIIAISEHTKQDFITHAGLDADKIEVRYLGVSETNTKEQSKPNSIDRYINTSWGDVKMNTKLPSSPFLLFVGGADPRRKLSDVVHAFNLLRAQGHNLHLVLAGDTMLGPNSVPNTEARKALLSSSYLDDIYLLGFVNNSTREWLYNNALAFIYPSRYEGFGLPILEAMRYKTPVITYRNSSITEIAQDKVIYASGYMDITLHTANLLSARSEVKAADDFSNHTNLFTWEKTANMILSSMKEL